MHQKREVQKPSNHFLLIKLQQYDYQKTIILKQSKRENPLKGLYWLILGLCVWFIPTIIFQIIVTSEDSVKTAEEAVSEIPKEFVIILFAVTLPIIVKGVITTRKERKASRNEDSRKNKKSKK